MNRLPQALIRRLIMALFLAVTLVGCACTPPESKSLAVTLRPQQTSMWCWAASGQMVLEFLGHDTAQGVQANNRFGRTDCANSPVPNACVMGGWPEFQRYDFTSVNTTDAALSWAQVRQQIHCRNSPFAFTWHWPGGGGHMMVARGYATQNAIDYVEVQDPWPPNVGTTGSASIQTYAFYVSSTNHHTHWDDYYDVTYTGD